MQSRTRVNHSHVRTTYGPGGNSPPIQQPLGLGSKISPLELAVRVGLQPGYVISVIIEILLPV